MKNAIIGILTVSSFLTGCRSTHPLQSATPQSASPQSGAPQAASPQSNPPQSVIDIVRNGYLKYNQTTTIGNALAGTFQNAEWKSFTTEKGVTIVEFDGTLPLSKGILFCSASGSCTSLVKKIKEDCAPDPDEVQYIATLNGLQQQIQDADVEIADWSPAASTPDGAKEIASYKAKKEKLKSQIDALVDPAAHPKVNCEADRVKQDPTFSIAVRFTVNQTDASFQYAANDMGLPPEDLFKLMYN
jgi:hypothetical protein